MLPREKVGLKYIYAFRNLLYFRQCMVMLTAINQKQGQNQNSHLPQNIAFLWLKLSHEIIHFFKSLLCLKSICFDYELTWQQKWPIPPPKSCRGFGGWDGSWFLYEGLLSYCKASLRSLQDALYIPRIFLYSIKTTLIHIIILQVSNTGIFFSKSATNSCFFLYLVPLPTGNLAYKSQYLYSTNNNQN